MYFNERIETMERLQLRQLQSERLVKLVKYTYDNVKFYRERMDEAGVKPEDIKSIDDISKLPFMKKQDLRDYYPTDTFAAPMKDIVRFHASSGTTGKPIVAGYTQHDLDCWSEGVARCLTAYGVTKEDVVQVSYGYGLFTGGLGAHDGAQKVGAAVLPTSSGNTSKQLLLMKDLKTSALCCTPSYALYLAESIENDPNIDVDRDLHLRVGIFGAEPWTENMRKELENKLKIKAYDIYGLTEVSGPGVGGECEYQDGTHLWEDMFFPEIIDPVTLQPVEPGQEGELVFTTLTKEGMPVVRYRTRDLTHLIYDKCRCGRTMVRMGRILGRSDDMLIIRGVNVFPSTIESCILELPEFTGQYFVTVDRVNNVDTFDIEVELRPEFYGESMDKLLHIKDRLVGRLVSVLGIKPVVHIVEPNSIERSMGKAKHVLDKRNLSK
ncbi:MAG: phenylacetate--CoA ligase [Paludibacteraceae bacterium]|nr:phenylacetate--CoA ligase [Paludibacteraceae bacterium]MBR6041339.1 phenylacetate--CoA ligase [Paludibacteraceae bacterium]MCR5569185.1 phenylacetate--CoA ligase [Paludibacteraceae bacterium]